MVLAPRKLSVAMLSRLPQGIQPADALQQRLGGFSPTPGTPGILSDESPISARKSMISSGGMPYLSHTSCGPRIVLFMVLIRVTFGVTSCAMSLSPVLISTAWPAFSASSASVPITSSASTPGVTNSGRPIALTMLCSGSICARRSSGIGGRCDLYSANRSSRKVFPLASNTTATWLG